MIIPKAAVHKGRLSVFYCHPCFTFSLSISNGCSVALKFEVSRRADLDKGCSLPGTEAACEDDDLVVVVETVISDKATDRLLQWGAVSEVHRDIICIGPVG